MGKLKRKSLAKKITLTLLTTTVWASLASVGYAANLPTGGSVVDGDFTSFDGNPTETSTTATITQTSNRGVLNWESFDVGTGYTVDFKQPDIASMTLNRVTGNTVSDIAGTINANGSIAIVNPNGVMFAEGSTVNAAGIVASTADLDTESFMNGTLVFSQDNDVNGNVTINGTLNAESNSSTVNSALNLGGVEPATGFSTMNNVIRLVADGDVTVGTTGNLIAVTTTTITEEVDDTIGEEAYTVGESESTSVASGRILLRADQNADDIGTVVLDNTDADQIQSKRVDIYYNTDVTAAGINGTSSDNITGSVNTTDTYTQKDYSDYINEKDAYKAKIDSSVIEKKNDSVTGVNANSGTTTPTSKTVYMLVNNIEQVAAIEDATYGNLEGKYAQGTTIDASETLNWNSDKGFHPIGSASEATIATEEGNFTGVFNGNGGTNQYSISNLKIDRPTETNVGLFSTVVDGTIQSVKITGASSISGNTNVGAIAGSLDDNSVVKWSSTGSNVNVYGELGSEVASNNIGGLVGYSDGGSIYGSINYATVSALESDSVGGVIGYADAITSLNNVYNTSEVEGNNYVGGIAGSLLNTSKVTNSVNQGEITGTLDTGGIAGLVDKSSIESTYNKGIITGTTNTGGIAGLVQNESSLSKVYNTNEKSTLASAVSEGTTESTTLSTYGQVTGEINTGGLVGYFDDSTIDTAYNAGNVTGTGDNTGGLVGHMVSGTITNAYNADNNTVIYKDGLLGEFTYEGDVYSYSDSTGLYTNTTTGVTYTATEITTQAPVADRTNYSGRASTSNVEYNGFTCNGVSYTYSHDTGLYTKTSTGETYDVSAIDVEAPIANRVNNIRLAYRDANVVGRSYVGGLVGKVDTGTISKTYNAGSVSTIYSMSGASSTVGAIAGEVADGVTIDNSYYVTTNQDGSENLSNQTTDFGTNASSANISGITLADAEIAVGNNILWGTNDTSDTDNNWITYASETTPLLQAFMSDISIEREYDYNGEHNNLKSEDVKNLYGGAFFNYSTGDGKNVLSSTMTNSANDFVSGNAKVQATDSEGNDLYYQADGITVSTTPTATPAYWLYEREDSGNGLEQSIYTYDTSNLWSPQHGYLTSANAQVTINPIDLDIALTGTKVYGQDAVTGASTATDAGTSYDNGYGITYDGFVNGEDDTVLTGEIKYNTLGQAAIVYESDTNQLGADSYTLDSSKFSETSLTADNNNYAINYSGALTVSKANLYIDIDGTRVYGDANSTGTYTYSANEGTDNNSNDGTLKSWDNGKSSDLTGFTDWSHETITNLESATSVSHNNTVTGTAIQTNTNVKGTAASPEAYTLVNSEELSDGTLSNYNVVFDTASGSEGTFTINPATLQYEVEGQRVYGEGNIDATGSVTAVSTSLKADDDQGDVLDAPSGTTIAQWMAEEKYLLTETTNAGIYDDKTLTATQANAQDISIKYGNNNYVLADEAESFKFTITQAKLVFDVDNKTKIYGELNPDLTGDTGTGWVNNESLTNINNNGTYTTLDPAISMDYLTAADQESPVDSYKVRVSTSTKTSINDTTLNENYDITYKKGNLVISKADLNFSATGSSVYGTAPVIGDLTLKAVEVAANAEASETNDGSLKSWDSASKDDITNLTDFASTDPITLVTTIDGVETDIGTVTNVLRETDGTVTGYTLANGSFLDADDKMQLTTKNYTLAFVGTDNNFKVTPKELTFAVNSQTKIYGEGPDALTGSFTAGFVNDDNIEINSTTGEISTVSLNNNGSATKITDINAVGTLGYTAQRTDVTTGTLVNIDEKTNVGSYVDSLNADGFDLNNYTVNYVEGDMTINQKDLYFIVEDKSTFYGQDNSDFSVVQEGGFDGTGWVNGENLNYVNNNGTYTTTPTTTTPKIEVGYVTLATEESNVGDYAVDITTETKNKIDATTLNENYNIIYTPNTLVIKKANLYIDAVGERIYGDANSIDDYTYSADVGTNNELNGGDLKTWDAAAADNLASLGGNWETGTLGTVESKDDVTYNDGTTGKAILINTNVKGTAADPEAYELANLTGFSSTLTTNYNVIFDTTKGSEGTLTINPATLEYEVVGERVYGADNDTATGSVTAVNLKAGDTQAEVLSVANDTSSLIGQWVEDQYVVAKTTNVGEYTKDHFATATAKTQNHEIKIINTENYILADEASVFEFDITKKDVVFTVADNSKIYGEYDEVNPNLAGRFKDDAGFVNGDSIIIDSTTGLVTSASLNDDGTKVEKTDAASIGTLSYTAQRTDLTTGDLIDIDKKTNVGIYEDALNASGFVLENYNVTYVKGDMEITPATLTFTVADNSKIYGGENPDLAGSFTSGFVNDDSITMVDGAVTAVSLNNNGSATKITDKTVVGTVGYTAQRTDVTTGALVNIDEKTNAGTYVDSLNASGFVLTNYTVDYVKGDLGITPANLNFAVNSATKVYGQDNPAFSVVKEDGIEGTGWVNGESLNSVNNNGTPTDPNITVGYDTDATQQSNVGNYDIDVSDTTKGFINDTTLNENYNITYTLNELEVTKADLYIDIDGIRTYGDANSSADYTYSANVGTDEGDLKTWDAAVKDDLSGLDGWSHEEIDTLKSDSNVTHNGVETGLYITRDTDVKVTDGSIDAYTLANTDDLGDGISSNYNIIFDTEKDSVGRFTINPADLYFNAEGERDYGVKADVDDFTYSASRGVSNTIEGALKTGDASSENDLTTLNGFAKNGTDDLILWTDVNGTRTQIGTVTNVDFDSDNNVIGYTLADGSFARADINNPYQLGSLNYNLLFEGGSYTINTLPIPGEPEYQETISVANRMGGFREPNDIASILYLKVVDNGINVNVDSLNYVDIYENLGDTGSTDSTANTDDTKN